MSDARYDIIIVGGGVMGSSTAYHLMVTDSLRVAVVERDPTYARASTPLSIGNVRTQFNLKENVRISQYAYEFLEHFEETMAVDDIKPHIAWHREGNLFLVAPEQQARARQEMAMQRELGCHVEWWPQETLAQRLGHCNIAPYTGATYGPDEGTMDPYAVLMGFRRKAKSLGADYLTDEVTAVTTRDGAVSGVRLATGQSLSAKIVLNCAGAWAGEIAKTAGVHIPVVPVKRQVFAVDPKIKQERMPRLTVLPSGLYIAREAGGTLFVSKTLAEDPIGFDFTWDEARFMEIVWPELAEFNPQLETLKLIRGWAGLYAVNTLDANAILGEWPELKGFFLANGFSGHGFQQAAAVGRHMAELMTGKETSMDLTVFGTQRVLDNQPIATNVIV
ncbi:MAG: FAD-dependent oxidoreductase [Desulfosarcinaceae bacterium]|nr:FAD-dependent oxidoreductase [Desulfosarcinaceae bacterium]